MYVCEKKLLKGGKTCNSCLAQPLRSKLRKAKMTKCRQ